MGVKAVTVTQGNMGGKQFVWENLVDEDTGTPVFVGDLQALTVQFVGTYDSAAPALEGSNDGTNYAAFSTAITPAVNIIATIPAGVRFIRPNMGAAGGASADVDCYVNGVMVQ